jgi:hypothetical protein
MTPSRVKLSTTTIFLIFVLPSPELRPWRGRLVTLYTGPGEAVGSRVVRSSGFRNL